MASTKAYNEDKVALIIGCFIFLLALGKFAGLDLLGWASKWACGSKARLIAGNRHPKACCLAWGL